MRWLTCLIVVLTTLIIGVVILFGYGLFKTSSEPGWRLTDLLKDTRLTSSPKISNSLNAVSQPSITFGTVSLSLPDECTVTNVTPGISRAYLTVGPRGHCHRVVIIDLKNGNILGTVIVHK